MAMIKVVKVSVPLYLIPFSNSIGERELKGVSNWIFLFSFPVLGFLFFYPIGDFAPHTPK